MSTSRTLKSVGWLSVESGARPGLAMAEHVGFHIWAAYSYSPNAAWSNLVEEFLEAKHDAEQLKTFVNTILGEVWEDEYASKVSGDSLMQRAAEEKYKQAHHQLKCCC